MNLPITLTDLQINKMNIDNQFDPTATASGIIVIEASAAYGEIETVGDNHCVIYHDLNLTIRGVTEGGEEPIFTVTIEASGKFLAQQKDVDKARDDEEIQTCVSSNISDAMYLGLRSYLDQSFSLMGLKNIYIPWSFELEKPAQLPPN
jgi:hypothetical protein